MGYFVFMQEKRRSIQAWAHKSNAELQFLCDPLWKALSKEEKDKYKSKKKQAKWAELDKHVKDRQREDKLAKDLDIRSLRLARDQFLVKRSKKKIILLEMETPSTAYVAPERELLRVQEFLQKCARNRIGKLFVREEIVGFTSYSGDGKMYRCQVLSCDKNKATVKFIDYGNEEDVDIEDIYSLIGELETLKPLRFKLNIPNVELVKNTEKNMARIEKKLQVENLFVSLDEKGVPTLYNDLEPIIFNAKPKPMKKPIKVHKRCGDAGKRIVGKQEEVDPGPEKIAEVNGNLPAEDSVVKPEVEESENDALTDGNNTDQVEFPSQETGDDDTRGEDEVAPEAPVEVLDAQELKNPIAPVELDCNANAGDDIKPQHKLEDLVEKLISMLPEVKVEVERSGLLTDSTMKVLEGLVGQLDSAEFQCVLAVVESSLPLLASQTSSGARLVLAVLKRSSRAEKLRVLGRLYQAEMLVSLLSSLPGFQAMVWSLSVCSEEEVAALISPGSVIINTLAQAYYAPYFLTAFVKKFPQASAGLLDEILGQFDVLKRSASVMDFFMSLTDSEIGLTKVIGWISQRFPDVLKDEDKVGYVIKVIGKLESQHSLLIETLWRSLVEQKLFLPLASSPLGSSLLAGMVEAVVYGRCGGEGLRSEVISVLALHVDALCATPEGIKILKVLKCL